MARYEYPAGWGPKRNMKVHNKNIDKPPSLTEQAREEIKWLIISDQLKSGILMTESDLCEVTGFGKAPIRTALIELKQERLIDIAPRKGFFIRPWSEEEAGQLLDIRAIIEPELAARTARMASEEDLNNIRKIVESAAFNVRDQNRKMLVKNDNDFHIAVARASGQRVGTEVVEVLKTRSHFLWHVSLSRQELLERVQLQHERILAALIARDQDAARRLMLEHLGALGRT